MENNREYFILKQILSNKDNSTNVNISNSWKYRLVFYQLYLEKVNPKYTSSHWNNNYLEGKVKKNNSEEKSDVLVHFIAVGDFVISSKE